MADGIYSCTHSFASYGVEVHDCVTVARTILQACIEPNINTLGPSIVWHVALMDNIYSYMKNCKESIKGNKMFDKQEILRMLHRARCMPSEEAVMSLKAFSIDAPEDENEVLPLTPSNLIGHKAMDEPISGTGLRPKLEWYLNGYNQAELVTQVHALAPFRKFNKALVYRVPTSMPKLVHEIGVSTYELAKNVWTLVSNQPYDSQDHLSAEIFNTLSGAPAFHASPEFQIATHANYVPELLDSGIVTQEVALRLGYSYTALHRSLYLVEQVKLKGGSAGLAQSTEAWRQLLGDKGQLHNFPDYFSQHVSLYRAEWPFLQVMSTSIFYRHAEMKVGPASKSRELPISVARSLQKGISGMPDIPFPSVITSGVDERAGSKGPTAEMPTLVAAPLAYKNPMSSDCNPVVKFPLHFQGTACQHLIEIISYLSFLDCSKMNTYWNRIVHLCKSVLIETKLWQEPVVAAWLDYWNIAVDLSYSPALPPMAYTQVAERTAASTLPVHRARHKGPFVMKPVSSKPVLGPGHEKLKSDITFQIMRVHNAIAVEICGNRACGHWLYTAYTS